MTFLLKWQSKKVSKILKQPYIGGGINYLKLFFSAISSKMPVLQSLGLNRSYS